MAEAKMGGLTPKLDWSIHHVRLDVARLWMEHGGEHHGPHVERISMPMERFQAFVDATLAAALADKDKRIAELEALTHRNGVFKCPACSLRVVSTNLGAMSGTSSPSTSCSCPNCNGPSWLISWKDECLSAEANAEAMFDRLSTLRQQAEGIGGAPQQAHAAMQAVTIFVTSKERIKEPEGRIWWAERMAEARDRLSAFRASSTGDAE